MNNHNPQALALVVLTLFSCTHLHAETRYVSDELVITIRSGQSTQHQVIDTIKTGTRVQVLSRNAETGYSHIRYNTNQEGWALSQYLNSKPTANILLSNKQKQLADNKEQYDQLKRELHQLTETIKQSKKQATEFKKEIDKLRRELSRIRNMAGHAPALSDENLHLKADLIRMETELQTYEQENMLLRDRSARDWFIAGTGVVLIGFIMGLLIHRINSQKKSNWSEL